MFNPDQKSMPQVEQESQLIKDSARHTGQGIDIKYGAQVSRYFSEFKKEFEGTDDDYESFLAENETTLSKLSNPGRAKRLSPQDTAFALSELAGQMANGNTNIEIIRDSNDPNAEKRYIAAKDLFMKSSAKIFDGASIELDGSSLAGISKGLKRKTRFDIGTISISQTVEFLKNNPKKLAEQLDGILYTLGAQLQGESQLCFKQADSEDRKKWEVELAIATEQFYKLQLFRDKLQEKIYGRSDTTPNEAKQIDIIRSKIGEEKPSEQDKITKLKKKVIHNISILQQGLQINLGLKFKQINLELSQNDPRLEKLADSLEMIRKDYQNDNRLRDKKNPEFNKRVDDLFASLKK